MPAPVFSGPKYLYEGLKLVLSRDLRSFLMPPLMIHLVLFVGYIYFASECYWLSFCGNILSQSFLMPWLPIFTFTMLANFIAAPFNGFLAEKVEAVTRGVDNSPSFSWGKPIAMLPRTLTREIRKLGYFLPRVIALLILSLTIMAIMADSIFRFRGLYYEMIFGALRFIAFPLWLIFEVRMMSVQYINYPAGNHGLGWDGMLTWLREKPWQSFSFGGVVCLGLLIPVINILIMPAAVAGAALFWVHERGDEALAKSRAVITAGAPQ